MENVGKSFGRDAPRRNSGNKKLTLAKAGDLPILEGDSNLVL